VTTLILVRHGQSQWNARSLFTGWGDPPLTDRGRRQAQESGRQLASRVDGDNRVDPLEVVHTSQLARARETAAILLASAGMGDVPVRHDWRLNERHLGQLQGLTKRQVVERWSNRDRKRWRDDPSARPPALPRADPRHPIHDPHYRGVPCAQLPGAECACDTEWRVLAYWQHAVLPDLRAGRCVMVVSHLGPIRSILRHLSCQPAGPAEWTPVGHSELLVLHPELQPDGRPELGSGLAPVP
jgi:2,3-bisphosphoglycerate-dependent phosphoglycerate mutase